MSEGGLFASYAEVLSICQSNNELDSILDPEDGYAPRMRQICHDHIADLEDRPDSRSLREELEILRLEENAWGLLQAVMPARKTDPPASKTARELLLENPYTPTSTLAQAIMNASPLLTELIAVREWLQETAPPPTPPEANTGYWKFTKHTVMQSLRTGHAQRDGLVSEMDPDAVNKGDGASLAADDASYEKNLLQALYGYVRAGKLEDAVEICRLAHQPWRAASLRGSLFFTWKALSTDKKDQDSEETDGDFESFSGNPKRTLWKSTCTRAALNPLLSDQERLLYASIAPSVETSTILKSSCRTWEDHLWADISVLCEDKTGRELARLATASFWEGGVEGLDKPPAEQSESETVEQEETWEQDVSRVLESLQSVAVAEGPAADHSFHLAQLFIILNKIEDLLNGFAHRLRRGAVSSSSFEYETVCRFFAHLCLYLQMIDVQTPPDATQVILESYISVLEEAGQRNLIALYAGALGDNAVDRYAAFLVSLGLTADFDERRAALTRASEHGLDVNKVALKTAESSINKAFSMLPQLKSPLPSIINLQPPINEAETFLLRSIEWTTFSPDTHDAALIQATTMLRYFLGAGRIQAAQTLLSLLPPELASLTTPEEIATEYMHYNQFFVIWDTIAKVVNVQGQEAAVTQGPSATREAKATWLSQYRNLIDQAHEQIVRLLTVEWLIAEEEAEDDAEKQRQNELARIRQIYVPELIIRLHYILFGSRKLIPQNLKRALELANIVADARYKLYDDFVNDGGRTLSEYLGAVRQAVLAGLEGGGSDPFRVVTYP
ncbi:hypothetical protein CPC08DRAFT_819621 [Agrocybe pediades]|nr:hypothetical protein CPC08DRAFT_819621 [Agrocybe pediades]